jgi:DNA repair exonuclease SbcCD nuclease subunit
MKIALITDTHAGVRNDNPAFHDKSKIFYDNIFFPKIRNEGIDTVFHLGDIVDKRKFINFNSAHRLRTDFLQPMENMGLSVHFIAGNHDCTFKSTNEVNALEELIEGKYKNFYTISNMTACNRFNKLGIMFIPWICDDNRNAIFKNIEVTNATVVFGHLELKGFEMQRGLFASSGDDYRLFSKFDLVCSGHFHHKSSLDNIHYLGAHMEFTWADYNDPRGFHIFDTDTLELEFIQNPYRMFKKVYYDDSGDDLPEVEEDLAGCFVRVVVVNKTNVFNFEKFYDKIEKQNPANLQIVSEHKLGSNSAIALDSENSKQDTLSICYKTIDEITSNNKDKLKTLITELYNDANRL